MYHLIIAISRFLIMFILKKTFEDYQTKKVIGTTGILF